MYPNNGIGWTHEGEIVFKGSCMIGNNSFIVTGKQGRIVFGDDFRNSTSARIISFCGITFGEHVSLGWEVTIMDTNFHPLFDREKQQFKRAYGRINIGDYNWISTQSVVLHSVETPHHCYFGLRSIITRGGDYESYCLYGGSPLRVLSSNVERIIGQDRIKDYTL
jgi:acetyltransferase-like isoleucine patch superfamily enzyme